MTLLVDDQQLSAALGGEQLVVGPLASDTVCTTGLWYVRLCQAVVGAVERNGASSTPFDRLPGPLRREALARLLSLPDEIELVSLRELGPVTARLRRRHRLNLIGLEALAAAVHLHAHVVLSARSPQLEAALRDEGCAWSTC